MNGKGTGGPVTARFGMLLRGELGQNDQEQTRDGKQRPRQSEGRIGGVEDRLSNG